MNDEKQLATRIERTKGVVAMSDEEFRQAMSTPGGIIKLSVDALKKPGALFHVSAVPAHQ